MHKLSRLAALLVAGAIVSAPAFAAEKGNAFAAEQKAQGAPDSPELQAAVKEELVRREILAQEAKKKGLDKNPNIQGQIELAKQAVLIRAFLAEKEEDAKAIIAKLDKGEKFSELAKQSKDPGSKDKGGELGWSSPAAYVKPFGEALTKLKKGEYTKVPVHSDFGYHVIQLDDSRPMTPPPFEQVKPQLQQRAGQQQVENLVKELRTKAKVD